jgi:hypothetical protein
MAALMEWAQETRVDAERLRGQARELRVMARSNVARSHERLGRAQAEADKARGRRLQPLPSPWSALQWMQTYDTLERTLVPLP